MAVTMPQRRLECGHSQSGSLRSLLCPGLSWITRRDYEGTFGVWRSAFGVRRFGGRDALRAIRRRTSMKIRIQGVKNSRIQEVDRLAALLFDNIFRDVR